MCPVLSRRSLFAGLAASACAGNYAWGQDDGNAPSAADAIEQSAPVAAPDLRFADADGRKLSLADYRGSGLVVSVWATWCPPCVAEFPTLVAVAPKLAASKILILPISVDDEGVQVVRDFYARHAVTQLPILMDSSGSALDALNTGGIPTTIVVNPAGQLVGRAEGAANWDDARTVALLQRLAGPVLPQSGVQPVGAIGCSLRACRPSEGGGNAGAGALWGRGP